MAKLKCKKSPVIFLLFFLSAILSFSQILRSEEAGIRFDTDGMLQQKEDYFHAFGNFLKAWARTEGDLLEGLEATEEIKKSLKTVKKAQKKEPDSVDMRLVAELSSGYSFSDSSIENQIYDSVTGSYTGAKERVESFLDGFVPYSEYKAVIYTGMVAIPSLVLAVAKVSGKSKIYMAPWAKFWAIAGSTKALAMTHPFLSIPLAATALVSVVGLQMKNVYYLTPQAIAYYTEKAVGRSGKVYSDSYTNSLFWFSSYSASEFFNGSRNVEVFTGFLNQMLINAYPEFGYSKVDEDVVAEMKAMDVEKKAVVKIENCNERSNEAYQACVESVEQELISHIPVSGSFEVTLFRHHNIDETFSPLVHMNIKSRDGLSSSVVITGVNSATVNKEKVAAIIGDAVKFTGSQGALIRQKLAY